MTATLVFEPGCNDNLRSISFDPPNAISMVEVLRNLGRLVLILLIGRFGAWLFRDTRRFVLGLSSRSDNFCTGFLRGRICCWCCSRPLHLGQGFPLSLWFRFWFRHDACFACFQADRQLGVSIVIGQCIDCFNYSTLGGSLLRHPLTSANSFSIGFELKQRLDSTIYI